MFKFSEISDKCVKCGKCIQVCTIHHVNSDETTSPRGFLDLVGAYERGELKLDKNVKNIFESFVQIGSEQSGAGLGLSITKKLLEVLNGKIEVESKVGIGSTFKIQIPIETSQKEFENFSDVINKILKGAIIMSFITVKNLSFKYPNGTENVLNDVSLEVKKGEKVAIIGQNGAGKTTMVKMLNGLLKPVSGDVVVDDWNTKKYTVAKMSRKVGYVFQNPMDQIFHNNVYDEIAFGAKKLKYSPDETKAMVENAIKLTELEKYQKENPYNLPYSMRKFVTIAAVIAMGSDVIIMDEPTAGQDFRGMRVLHNLIDELQKQGKTIITITHDMEFVVKNFDRVIVMTNGKVIADGDKRDIFWQFDTLDKSMVKQPYISDLAKEMEMGGKILSVEEFVRNH